MIPKTSLSTTIPSIFSSDDELIGDDKGNKIRSKSARFSSKNKSIAFSDDKKENSPSFSTKLMTNSRAINQASKDLDSSFNAVKSEINGAFDQFHKALNQQQTQLFHRLQTVEQKLFQIAKQSKNAKSKQYQFDPNIKLIQ